MNHIDPRIFPTILMTLDFIAAIVWAFHGDFRKEVLSAKNLLTNAAQNAQMNFYDEFIAELKEPPEGK